MKKFHFWHGAVLLFIFSSCEKIVGEGPLVTETRTATQFQGLSVSVPADAYFTQSPDYSVTLEAQQNILDEIETVVSDNVLKIRFRHSNVDIRTSQGITIHVTGPTARILEMNGSGNLMITGKIDPTELDVNVSGSGNVDIGEIETNRIEAVISGSGRINVEAGAANSEKITISGSGDADLAEIIVKDAEALISGSGSMKIHATETLKAKISGSGTVYYKGSPDIHSTISGSGSVVKL
jgi:hypothetical protein